MLIVTKNISTALIALLPYVNTNNLFTKKEFLDKAIITLKGYKRNII